MKTVDNHHQTIQTHSGIYFPVFDPDPSLVQIQDIAHALSNLCRYGGHCRQFYSVAQHSYLCSHLGIPRPKTREQWRTKLHLLMHDATEAYLIDVPRPVKHHFGELYSKPEEKLAQCINRYLEIPDPTPAIHDFIKSVDNRMLVTERHHIMTPTPGTEWELCKHYNRYGDLDGYGIPEWHPSTARNSFLSMFAEIQLARSECGDIQLAREEIANAF